MILDRKVTLLLLLISAALGFVGCRDDDVLVPRADRTRGDPSAPAVVQLVSNRPTYRLGETVVVDISISNARNVGSVPFHLRYSKDVLVFLPPGLEGPFMGSDGADTVFLATDIAGGGELVVGISRLNVSHGAVGQGILATLRFQALDPGPCNFEFTGANVKDPQARNLPAVFSSTAVDIVP
jgi:hypothetical protein